MNNNLSEVPPSDVTCGGKIRVMRCEIFSRCVGYYRPIGSWNAGKRAEYNDRHTHSVKDFEDASKMTFIKPRPEEKNVERGKSNSVQARIG